MHAATKSHGILDPAIQHLLLQLQDHHALEQTPGSGVKNTGSLPVPAGHPHPAVESTSSHGISSSTAVETHGFPATTSGPAGPDPITPPRAADVSTPVSTVMKRKSIPLSMKKEAIQWILGPGNGVPSRAEKHFHWNVSASSFRKWWKNRDKIMQDSGSSKKRVRGGGRKPFLEDSEEQLLVVVIQERAKKDRVTRKWIAKTAQHMFQRSDTCFKASENWVSKFIRRNRLTLKRSCVTYEPPQANVEHPQCPTLQTATTATNPAMNTT